MKKKRDQRADSRRFATNVSLGILLGVSAIAVVAIANRWMERAAVKQLRIIGTVVLDSADIARAAQLNRDVAMSEIDLEAVENRVAAHPFVTDAAVYRAAGGRIVIEVSERTPMASLIIGGRPYYVDGGGVILPYRFGVASADVPVITGCASGLTVDSACLKEGIRLARALSSYGGIVSTNVSEIERAESGEFSLHLTDATGPVRIGRVSGITRALPKLEALLLRLIPQHHGAEMRYADLRWSGQVIVSWNRNASKEQNSI